MKRKYKIGDKVKIKDLTQFDRRESPGIVSHMIKYCRNKTGIIVDINENSYTIEIIGEDEHNCCYDYLEKWIEPVLKNKLKNILSR